MSIHLWFAFVVAAAIMLVIPGPTVILVITLALGQGRRAARATVAGVAVGDLVALTLSLARLGAILKTLLLK